jgi:hypothetical protein
VLELLGCDREAEVGQLVQNELEQRVEVQRAAERASDLAQSPRDALLPTQRFRQLVEAPLDAAVVGFGLWPHSGIPS